MLKETDLIHRLVGAQHRVEMLRDLRGKRMAEQVRHAPALGAHDASGHVLQERVDGRDDALLLEVLEAVTQDEERLRGEHREALCTTLEFGLRDTIAKPEAKQLEDAVLHGAPGGCRRRADGAWICLGRLAGPKEAKV